jgi:hypothetical protein
MRRPRQAKHAGGKFVELRARRGRGPRPTGAGDRDPFVQSAAATGERDVEGVELLFEPAGADTEA